MTQHLASFLLLSAILIVVPGPDMALVARNALVGGRRAVVATSAGSAAGLCIWTVAASVGLAALLRASEPAFLALRLVGAAYLFTLGARAL
jgi:threonine/homoserine/homoserine lactone efflux protein